MKKIGDYFTLLTGIIWVSLLIFLTLNKFEIWPITIGLLLSPVYSFILKKNNTSAEGQELIGLSLLLSLSTTAIVWGIIWLFTQVL